MNSKSILKCVWLLGFIALAGVSCWATTESLHLLLPSWPKVLCWIVTITFFIVASLGTKLIVDSLNQSVYCEKRGLKLIGGIVLLLVFWLVCSMPTNTHTFFYKTAITDVVKQDLNSTQGYLVQLRDNVKTEEDIRTKQEELDTKVNAQLIALCNEIDNIANQGFGDNAKNILPEIATTLKVDKIPLLSYKNNSPAQRRHLKDQYRTMIYELLNKRKAEIAQNYHNAQEEIYKKEATGRINNIDNIMAPVQLMAATNEIDENIITQANATLNDGYYLIKQYKDFVNFASPADEELYLAENQVTRTSKMLSVVDVWKDYLAGRFAGRGFIFWVIISMLVDIAAFIFFDMAFRKKEY